MRVARVVRVVRVRPWQVTLIDTKEYYEDTPITRQTEHRQTPGLPAYTWNAIDSVLNRLSLVTQLEQIDSWSAAFVGEWSEKLTAELSNPQEGFFVKARLSHLFSELSMCKDLNARLVERKYTFASQAQAASHAAASAVATTVNQLRRDCNDGGWSGH